LAEGAGIPRGEYDNFLRPFTAHDLGAVQANPNYNRRVIMVAHGSSDPAVIEIRSGADMTGHVNALRLHEQLTQLGHFRWSLVDQVDMSICGAARGPSGGPADSFAAELWGHAVGARVNPAPAGFRIRASRLGVTPTALGRGAGVIRDWKGGCLAVMDEAFGVLSFGARIPSETIDAATSVGPDWFSF